MSSSKRKRWNVVESIGALLMGNPSFAPMVEVQMGGTPNVTTILHAIKRCYDKGLKEPSVKVITKEYKDLGGDEAYLVTVLSLVSPMTAEEAQEEMIHCLATWQEQNHHYTVTTALSKAHIMLANGRNNEAVMLLKGLPFVGSKREDSIKNILIDALVQEDVFNTGIPYIDIVLNGFSFANILSVAGDTGAMKTTSTLWMMIEILRNNPSMKGIYFEKEMPIKDIARRLITYITGIPGKELKGMSEENLASTVDLIMQMSGDPSLESIFQRLIIVGPTDFSTVADMWQLIEHHRANIWCLDYLTQLDSSVKGSDTNKEVRSNMNALKKMVHHTNTFGIIINQLNKNTIERRNNKIPVMDDIEWSSDIKKLSAHTWTVFTPARYHQDDYLARHYHFKQWYFIISMKNREERNYVIYLLADPAKQRFETPSLEVELEMKKWLDQYMDMFPIGVATAAVKH